MSHFRVFAVLLGDLPPRFPGTSYTMPRPLSFGIAGCLLAIAILTVIWVQVRRQSKTAGLWAVTLLIVIGLTGVAMSMSHRAYRRRTSPIPLPLPVRPGPATGEPLLPPIEEFDEPDGESSD